MADPNLNPQYGREFCFIVEDESFADAVGAAASAGAAATPMHLAAYAVSYLVWSPLQPPRIESQPPATGLYLALETIRHDRQMSLLVTNPGQAGVTVNALPALPVVALATRDQVRLEGGQGLLRVSQWLRPYLGPAPESVVAAGTTCGCCGEKFKTGMRTYLCAHCGAPTHAETEETKVDEHALRCLEMGPQCPMCQQPLVLSEGLAWTPEVAHA